MRLLYAITASLLAATTSAVFADEAYQIDYHHALLGLPQEDNTFVHQPVASSKASLIYTLTDKSLFGAVNPKDGSIVWRQQLHGAVNSSVAILRAGNDGDVVATGTDEQVATWAASDGRLIWSHEFGDKVQIKDVRILEFNQDGSVSGNKDVLVLYQGTQTVVERRDADTGELKWQFTDGSGDAAHRLGLTGTTIHLISLHGTMLGGHKIKVTEIDAVNGQKADQHTLSDSDVASAEDILFISAGTAVPLLAWTDKSFKAVKVNLLGTKTVISLPVDKKGEELQSIQFHAPRGLNSLPHFLVQYNSQDSHWAEVFHIDLQKGAITKAYDLPKLAGKGAFATSTSDANVYFTRVAKGAMTVTSSASHGVLERYILDQFVSGIGGNPEPVFAVSEVMPKPGGARAAVRAALLLSSGDWILLLNGELAWSRPEALTLADSAVFVELPHGERLARELAIEEHASIPAAYIHRLKRHIKELQDMPAWLQQQPAKIVNSVLGKEAVGVATKADKFGFNKLVIVATTNGRLIAVDAGNGGKVAWNQPVPDYTSSGKWEAPTLQASAPGIVRVKTATGHWVYGVDGQLLRKGTDSKSKAPSASTITYEIVDDQLQGFSSDNKKAAIWTFKPKGGERILTVAARPAEDPVANIGIVLGDRRVLYKYLNPNSALVVSANDITSSISATLIDTTSGNVLYEAKHAGVEVTQPIAAALSENWLTYTFTYKASPITQSRGHVLVTAHLMESASPDDRGALGASSNYSSLQPLAADVGTPYILTQSFQIPEQVSSLSVSQTRQGITTRMLLAVVPNSESLVGIPTPLLDPRRPIGRAPTAMESMEGLTQYSPVLDFNPQWYLNHRRDVIGIRKVITEPAILESTSLVFAYGTDIFGTRATPSGQFDLLGKDFNKVQMLGTVAALFVGVVFVAPLVKRKQINMRWQL